MVARILLGEEDTSAVDPLPPLAFNQLSLFEWYLNEGRITHRAGIINVGLRDHGVNSKKPRSENTFRQNVEDSVAEDFRVRRDFPGSLASKPNNRVSLRIGNKSVC